MLNGLDLFSGIGGITRTLDGYVRPVAYCEIDPYARGVLLSRISSGDIPDAPVWDDVSSLHGAMLPRVDIIYGGFPCQDISVAGRGAGLGGKRSGLFFEVVRLAEEIKPKLIFLENVPAIRTRGLERVLEELTALRYDCRWGMLSAQDVGANHKRERWFLLAHSRSMERATGSEEQGTIREVPEDGTVDDSSNGPGSSLADASGGGLERSDSTNRQKSNNAVREGGRLNAWGPNWWDIEPNVGRVANGILKRVDRLRTLGNAVIPAQVREAFERLMGLKCAD
jgi:DNA (cytosine-5)-methyltransferase 1